MLAEIKKQQFLSRICRAYGADITTAAKLFGHKPISSLRLNLLKTDKPAQLVTQLSAIANLVPIPWSPNAFWIESGKDALVTSSFFAEGLITIQNSSSLIPVQVLNPAEGSSVLDACSSPGLKASHIAQLCGNKVDLIANEPDRTRNAKLRKLLELLGVKCRVSNSPAQFLAAQIEKQFDFILVDAPCSGEGMMDLSKPDALKYWSLKKVHNLAKLQKRILASTWKLLKPGGTLVYSTCTVSPEENEAVIDYATKKLLGVKVEEISDQFTSCVQALSNWENQKFDDRVGKAIRVIPDGKMEAFFVCKLTKMD